MTSFTVLEGGVLEAIARNRVGFFDAGFVEGSNTWIDVLAEEMGDPKVYRGVISSLIKKGVFESDGEAVYLTEAGAAAVVERKPFEPKPAGADYVAFEAEISSVTDHRRVYVATIDEAVRMGKDLVERTEETGVFMFVISGLDATGSHALTYLKADGKPWKLA